MYCEIVDLYFNVFSVEMQLEKKTWNVFFGRQSLGVQTGIPVYQAAWIRNWS